MIDEKKILSEKEKEVIKRINHPLYTIEFIEEWINRDDNVAINAVAALQAMGVEGFYEAVKGIADIEIEWIPCSERKPDANIGVLVTVEMPHGGTIVSTGWLQKGLWKLPMPLWLGTVTAWKPMPESWKGE